MKKIKISFHVVFKCFLLLLICSLVVFFVLRFSHFLNIKKIENQISNIHYTELGIVDVLGENLPIESVTDDETLEGFDVNNNVVRDDVEIKIFQKYSDSQKTRAVLLQYAMTLQMELSQPVLNRDVVIKIINEQSRADTCLSDTLVPRLNEESTRTMKDLDKIDEYTSFVKNIQFNTDLRRQADLDFYEYLDEIDNGNDIHNLLNQKEDSCDVDISILEN